MAAYANLACGGKKRASTQGVQCDVKRQNDGDWEDGSRVSGCGKAVGWVRGGTEGGFKKNEITDWVAANWPASNQSLVAWMREYIMYTIHPPYIRAPWNRPDASHWKSYFPVCCASLGFESSVETIIENERFTALLLQRRASRCSLTILERLSQGHLVRRREFSVRIPRNYEDK